MQRLEFEDGSESNMDPANEGHRNGAQHDENVQDGDGPVASTNEEQQKVARVNEATRGSNMATGLGTNQQGMLPFPSRNLRSVSIPVRTARDRIERASGTLAARIAEAREVIDQDLTEGEAGYQAARLLAMERGLQEAIQIFQGHFEIGMAAAGAEPAGHQDFFYDILTAPLPAATKELQLQNHPTPAELLQIADEHIGDLRTMRRALEDEEEAIARSRLSGSFGTNNRHPVGDDPPPLENRNMEEWERSFQVSAKRWQNDGQGVQQHKRRPMERVATPVMPNLDRIFQRRAKVPSAASMRVTNTAREWINRNRDEMGAFPPATAHRPALMQPKIEKQQAHVNDDYRERPTYPIRRHARDEGEHDRKHGRDEITGMTTFETVRLQPPIFSGKPEDWTTFWAYFKRAVDDKPIPGFEKQLHLLRCLKEGSPARRAVEVYPPSDGNYPVVVQLLKERFGDTDDLQRAIRARLLHLAPAKDNVNSPTTMIDEFERCVCQLEQLGANVDDDSFGPLLEAKLPVRLLTELRIRESMMGSKWSVREFRRAVSAQVRCMRSAESALAAMKDPEVRTDHRTERDHTGRGGKAGREPFQRAFMVRDSQPTRAQSNGTRSEERYGTNARFARRSITHANENESSGGNWPRVASNGPIATTEIWSCSLCLRSGHRPSKCRDYPTAQERRRRLIEQKRCLRCMSSDHLFKQCQRVNRCNACRKDDHHWLLCWKSISGGQSRSFTEHERRAKNHATLISGMGRPTHFTEVRDEQNVRDGIETNAGEQRAFTTFGSRLPAQQMICRVIAAAEEGEYECQTTLLLDPGSHVDCAETPLIQQLGPQPIDKRPLTVQVFGGKKQRIRSATYRLRLKRTDGKWESIEVSEVPHICTPIKTELIESGATPDSEPRHTDNATSNNDRHSKVLGLRDWISENGEWRACDRHRVWTSFVRRRHTSEQRGNSRGINPNNHAMRKYPPNSNK